MDKENRVPCLVFPMGLEAYPFLKRVEVRSRRQAGRAVYREAFFEGCELMIVKCGIGPVKAAAAMQNLRTIPAAIVSAGTAGALVADLNIGDLVVSSHTVSGDNPTEPLVSSSQIAAAAADACRRQGRPHRTAKIVTVTKPVFYRDDREILHRVTGAHAVDMESHVIGLEAQRLGVPFVALRAISDDMDCPPLPDFTRPKDLFRNPHQFPARLAALWRWRRFLKNLRFSVEVLHPVLVSMIRSLGRG